MFKLGRPAQKFDFFEKSNFWALHPFPTRKITCGIVRR